MIALIFATPGAGGSLNFAELAGDVVGGMMRSVRKLSLVPAAPAGMQTVAQFCAARGADLPLAMLSRIGRKASALSRAGGLLIGRATEAFGEVNAYDPAVLAEAFALVTAAPGA